MPSLLPIMGAKYTAEALSRAKNLMIIWKGTFADILLWFDFLKKIKTPEVATIWNIEDEIHIDNSAATKETIWTRSAKEHFWKTLSMKKIQHLFDQYVILKNTSWRTFSNLFNQKY